jgi:hypothetical protein
MNNNEFSITLAAPLDARNWVFSDPQRQSSELWEQFKNHFVDAVKASVPSELNRRTWDHKKRRTEFYENVVIPKIATSFKLQREKELFRVDAMVGKGTREDHVPIIHVEYENDAKSAHHEVRKLCVLGGQLKVLVTCAPWDKELWNQDIRFAKDYLSEWRARVKLQRDMYPNDCVYGLIVGERKKDKLRFYQTTLSEQYPDEPSEGNLLLPVIDLQTSGSRVR